MDLAAEQAAVFSAAAADITSGKCSIRKAAIHYGINVSKLHRVIQGRQGADANRGAPSSLPRIADNKLVEKLVLLICNNRYLSRVNCPSWRVRFASPWASSAPNEDLATKANVLLTSFYVASYCTKAVKELQRRRAAKGKSIHTDGFKAAGIYTLDPLKSQPKTAYAQAVNQHAPPRLSTPPRWESWLASSRGLTSSRHSTTGSLARSPGPQWCCSRSLSAQRRSASS